RDVDFDGRELDATHLGDVLCELARPAAGLSAEDRLQRFALLRVGALIHEDAHRGLGTFPDVALEVAQRDDIEAVERDGPVGAFPDVPDQDAVAIAVRRSTREFARAWNIALADIEPVALELPRGNVSHDGPFASCSCRRPGPGRSSVGPDLSMRMNS